jgi:NAD(P)-dependent dehydrogenase (short-subunit alcohol dehydrogenase family)
MPSLRAFLPASRTQSCSSTRTAPPTDRTKKILAATPMGHFGDSEKDLVGALLFLLNNDAAGFITGICLPVDGGFSAYSGV